MPQKQPPAITAVCFAGAALLASSIVGPGTGALAPLPALQAMTPAKRMSNIANMRTEILDITFLHLRRRLLSHPPYYQSYERGRSFGCFGVVSETITLAPGMSPAAFRVMNFPRNSCRIQRRRLSWWVMARSSHLPVCRLRLVS